MNYYNEFDPFAAAWLSELIKDGLIPNGEVDTRSITEVEPSDLKGYTQCHFFAGIGGWSYALQLAEWPGGRPVWTGSCPCQPFSAAGNNKGTADDRHLWPAWFRLIRECKPPAIFGEQVASAIRHGWLDDAFDDMEGEDYACAAVVLPACSVGAPHKRERIWFGALANSLSKGLQRHGRPEQINDSEGWAKPVRHDAESGDNDSSMGHTDDDGPSPSPLTRSTASAGHECAKGPDVSRESSGTGRSGESGDIRHWQDSQLIYCRDNKYRPISAEPALFPLLPHGILNRVGTLRGAGNAIVPQVAAEVIKAFKQMTSNY